MTLDRFGIDAPNTCAGEMTGGIGEDRVVDIRSEVDPHADHGHKVEFLDQEGVREQAGSPLLSAAPEREPVWDAAAGAGA